MLHITWLLLATFTHFPVLPTFTPNKFSQATPSTKMCQERAISPSHRCVKPCRRHTDCRSAKKQCYCDGDCGMSCINPDVRCRRLKGIKHGSVKQSPDNRFRDIAIYSCGIKYKLDGNERRTCRGNGRWSGKTPVCSSKTIQGCRPPIEIPHASFTPDKGKDMLYEIGEAVVYKCEMGYSMEKDDINTAWCQYDVEQTKWLGPTMTCSLAGCEKLPMSKFASVRYLQELHVYGAKAQITCIHGYMLIGPKSRVCQETGTWSGGISLCQPVVCKRIPKIPNAVMLGRVKLLYKINSRVKYKCRKGYIAQGNPYGTCTSRATWRGPTIYCSPRTCDYPEEVLHATIEGSKFVYPLTITYRCLKGYRMDGSPKRRCNATGYWTGRPPSCYPVTCEQLDEPSHGYRIGFTFTYNSVLTFPCFSGYLNIGSTHRTCQATGSWSGKAAKCVEAKCGPIPTIYNGYTDGSNTYSVGSVRFFRCNIFTTFEGVSMQTKCLPSGKWSHKAPICWGQCHVPKIDNGTVLNQVQGYWLNHNHTILYKCDQGLSLIGQKKAVCLNGTWSDVPKCAPEPCKGPPPNIANGQRIFFGESHGDRVRYQCLPGFRLRGSPYLQCQFGHWIGKLPLCHPAYCNNPGSLENGTIYKRGTNGKFPFYSYIVTIQHGLRIEYVCSRQYELIGPDGATCVDATWRPKQKPICQRSHHRPYVQTWHIQRYY